MSAMTFNPERKVPVIDWRKFIDDFDDDPDDEDVPTPPDVVAILGFDPHDEV